MINIYYITFNNKITTIITNALKNQNLGHTVKLLAGHFTRFATGLLHSLQREYNLVLD